MRKKWLSMVLAVVMTTGSISPVLAESFDVSSEAAFLEDSLNSGTVVSASDGIDVGDNYSSSFDDSGSADESNDSIDTGELPSEEIPSEEIPSEDTSTEPEKKTYRVSIDSKDADIIFKEDLEELKNKKDEEIIDTENHEVTDDSAFTDASASEGDTSVNTEVNLSENNGYANVSSCLPSEYLSYITEDSYKDLVSKGKDFEENSNCDFYVIPYDMSKELSVSYQDISGSTVDLSAVKDYLYSFVVNFDSSLSIKYKEVEESEITVEDTNDLDSSNAEEQLNDGSEEASEVECTCGSDSDNAYLHDWDCPVFLEKLSEDCTCDSFSLDENKLENHSFTCQGVLNAFNAICTCEVHDIAAMHDDCEVIRKLHSYLCDCGEDYCSIDDIIESHDENSSIIEYLKKWSSEVNQPSLVYTNNDKDVAKGHSPEVRLVNTNDSDNKDYAFVIRYRGAPTITTSKSLSTWKNNASEVLWHASNFTAKNDVWAMATYPNVGVYNGTALDLKIKLYHKRSVFNNYTGSNDYKPSVGFFKNRIGVVQYLVHGITCEMTFVQAGTSNPVRIKGHITIKDIDGNDHTYGCGVRVYASSNISYINKLNDSTNHLLVKYKKSSSNNYYTLIKGRHYANPNDSNLSESDKRGWLTFYFDSSSINFVTELGDDMDATSGSGNRHAGVLFDATVIPTYNPMDPPAKRSSPSNITNYDNMEWHNTTDGSKPEWQRPLDTVPGGTYSYGVAHTYYPQVYSKYVMSDTLDSCLTYVANSANVIVSSTKSNINRYFDISYDSKSHRLTFTANEGGRTFLQNTYDTLYFTFKVTVADKQTIIWHGHHGSANSFTTYYYLKNVASVTVNNDTKNTGETFFRGRVSGTYYVEKVDENDTSKHLEGAVFGLYERQSNGTYSYVKNLDYNKSTKRYSTGTLYWTGDNQGMFQIRETKAPDGYDCNYSTTINVGTTSYPDGKVFTATNHKIIRNFGTISIVKKDSVTGKIITDYTNAEFTIYEWNKDKGIYEDTCEATAKSFDSSESGNNKVTYMGFEKIYKSGNIYISDKNAGRFKVVETKNPTGYEGTWSSEFTLKKTEQDTDMDSKSFEVFNTPTIPPMGEIVVNKVIKESNILLAHGNPTFRFTVSGTDSTWNEKHTWSEYAEFRPGTYKTDSNGNAIISVVFKNIPIGTYDITEGATTGYNFQSCNKVTSNVSENGNYLTATLTWNKDKNTVDTAEGTFVNLHNMYDNYRHSDVVKNTNTVTFSK